MSSAFGLLRCQAPELDLILSFLRLLLDVFLDLLFGQAWADTSDEVALNPHLAAPILAFQPRIALKQHFRANALENLGGSGRGGNGAKNTPTPPFVFFSLSPIFPKTLFVSGCRKSRNCPSARLRF